MRIVGPQAFAVGTATSIVDPAASGGNPSVACQIQNSSSYQLTVAAGGAQLSIQPFWAQTVEISGQPIAITPQAGTGSGTAEITLAFLLGVAPQAGAQLADGTWVETPPQEDGALTAAAIEASNPGPTIAFGPTNVPSGTNSPAINLTNTTRTVIIRAFASGLGVSNIISTTVAGANGNIYLSSQNGAPYLGSGNFAGPAIYVISIPGAIEPTIKVNVTTSDGSPATVEVLLDTLEYKQDVFYNGVMQAQAATAINDSVQVVVGPLRLLTAEIVNIGSAVGTLSLNGVTVIAQASGAGASQVLEFPDNTILPRGDTIFVTNNTAATATEAGITWAYP